MDHVSVILDFESAACQLKFTGLDLVPALNQKVRNRGLHRKEVRIISCAFKRLSDFLDRHEEFPTDIDIPSSLALHFLTMAGG